LNNAFLPFVRKHPVEKLAAGIDFVLCPDDAEVVGGERIGFILYGCVIRLDTVDFYNLL